MDRPVFEGLPSAQHQRLWHTGSGSVPETPAGVFAIIEKDKDHHSTLYDDAWMPNSPEMFPGDDLKWGLSFLLNTKQGPAGRSAGTLSCCGLANTPSGASRADTRYSDRHGQLHRFPREASQ
jgi:hypothetical protein